MCFKVVKIWGMLAMNVWKMNSKIRGKVMARLGSDLKHSRHCQHAHVYLQYEKYIYIDRKKTHASPMYTIFTSQAGI